MDVATEEYTGPTSRVKQVVYCAKCKMPVEVFKVIYLNHSIVNLVPLFLSASNGYFQMIRNYSKSFIPKNVILIPFIISFGHEPAFSPGFYFQH